MMVEAICHERLILGHVKRLPFNWLHIICLTFCCQVFTGWLARCTLLHSVPYKPTQLTSTPVLLGVHSISFDSVKGINNINLLYFLKETVRLLL